MPEQYRLLVLLAVFGSLRWGEVTALRRCDLDLERGAVTVRGALSERSTGEMVLGPPKSAAGLRTVMLPAPVAEQLRDHLDAYVGHHDQAWIFSGTAGQPLRRSNFNKLVSWSEVVQQMGLTGLHFHDLRHTGNHLAAQTPGATLRDLMVRMGHGSMRAALIYQHASQRCGPPDRRFAERAPRPALAGPGNARRVHGGRRTTGAREAGSREGGSDLGRQLERVTRIELALSAWEADVLPLNYTRVVELGHASALQGWLRSPR